MPQPTPAAPTHILRAHRAAISALHISPNNALVYSGDASGWIFVTSTRTLRTIASWQGHTDTILGLEEAGGLLITHGRDNKLHAWPRPRELPASAQLGGSAVPVAGASAQQQEFRQPTYSMDVNALNYCRFSLLPRTGSEALIAVPNLVDSSCADVWEIPSRDRLYAAIGKPKDAPAVPLDGRGNEKTGIIMSLHLFQATGGPSSSASTSNLRLLSAYEHGGVILRQCTAPAGQKTVEGKGWDVIWTSKVHAESIMAMAVTRDNALALTVSADHLIGRYDLNVRATEPSSVSITHRTKHPGNACIATRDDGRVCAVGGWDGGIRLYSTKTLKPLGTLRYHKTSVQALAFAHSSTAEDIADDSDSDDNGDATERERWLVAGGKDNRLTIWALQSFERSG
ncbi:WD40 repeat-like protein [Schizophyllum commune H4-8]|nr:WD40 repeat-like protein [Schizophyllum commune H4-8]KAI5892652.1 WD40 repeat-like protein [Schizophyllum commune H4-8]